MRKPPEGWPRISSALFYEDAAKAIDWLTRAFDYGGGLVMVGMAPTTTDYGEDYWSDRSYEAIDPEGHHWWFMQRLRG